MITPQQIDQVSFSKASFGGYNMAMVDEFLDELTDDYTALYKENMNLKNKMKVLVDKIEEYRSVDEEMRKALYSAQVTARELVQKTQAESQQVLDNARREAENILEAAHAEAEGRVAGMQQAIHEEEERLRQAREVSAAYSQTVIELLQKSITAIQMIADSAPEAGSVVPPAAAAAVPAVPSAPPLRRKKGRSRKSRMRWTPCWKPGSLSGSRRPSRPPRKPSRPPWARRTPPLPQNQSRRPLLWRTPPASSLKT